jgi:ketosteroid isomerase-like protein
MEASMISVTERWRIWVCALFSFAIVLVIGSDRGNADSAEEVVRDVVTRYHKALAAGDSVSAQVLLGDDVVVLENGYFESAEEYLSHHLPADMAFASSVPSERGTIRVTLGGDVAWATSISRSIGEFRGKKVDTIIAELMVLSRAEGEWKIRAIHWSSRRRN